MRAFRLGCLSFASPLVVTTWLARVEIAYVGVGVGQAHYLVLRVLTLSVQEDDQVPIGNRLSHRTTSKSSLGQCARPSQGSEPCHSRLLPGRLDCTAERHGTALKSSLGSRGEGNNFSADSSRSAPFSRPPDWFPAGEWGVRLRQHMEPAWTSHWIGASDLGPLILRAREESHCGVPASSACPMIPNLHRYLCKGRILHRMRIWNNEIGCWCLHR